MANKENTKELTLEEGFKKVEELMEEMQGDEISLEDTFSLYKEGMELLKACSDKIDKVEKQVLVLNGEELTEDI